MPVEFLKMHGLGNDFVVFDVRHRQFELRAAAVRRIADRHLGVGCDQILVIEEDPIGSVDAFMRIHNADGTEVAACGNGARAIAWVLAKSLRQSSVRIRTRAGIIRAEIAGEERVTVDMGQPRLGWSDIPLARAMDTLALELDIPGLERPVAVSMGNPHVIFFVADVAALPLESLGPQIERDALFPERTNVEFVQPMPDGTLRTRVWERGVGVTRACGTGACAVQVAAARRGLAPHLGRVALDGGDLEINWTPSGQVLMTGPVALSFRGTLSSEFLDGAMS